jgi:ribosome-binding protein aMBF1 (putative translation factor)
MKNAVEKTWAKKIQGWIQEMKTSGTHAEETFIIESREVIYEEMVRRGLSEKDLANLLKVPVKDIKKILSGERGTTIESTARYLDALDYVIEFKFITKEEKQKRDNMRKGVIDHG